MTEPVISAEHPLCLGSASPRRLNLLSGLGLPLRVVVGNVDEEPRQGEAPLDYLVRVVRDKMNAVAGQYEAFDTCSALLVADTIVRVEDRVIGKPRDIEEALAMLSLLCGREHIVHTRYALSSASRWNRPIVERTVTSSVHLRAAPLEVLRRYANTREGLDKAGAYAVQGIGSFLVQRIQGSYSNVVGLPVCEVVEDLLAARLLREFP